MTAAPSGKEWYTVPQVARALNIHVQSVYDAVKKGRMEARGQGRERRIHAREVVGYAVRTGRNVDGVVAKMEEVSGEIDWRALVGWVLAGVGLYALLKNLKE